MKLISLIALIGATAAIRTSGVDLICKGTDAQKKTCADSRAAVTAAAAAAYAGNVKAHRPEVATAVDSMKANAKAWTDADNAGHAARTAAVKAADSSPKALIQVSGVDLICKGTDAQKKTCADSRAAVTAAAAKAYADNVKAARPEVAAAADSMRADAKAWTAADNAGNAARTAAVKAADSSPKALVQITGVDALCKGTDAEIATCKASMTAVTTASTAAYSANIATTSAEAATAVAEMAANKTAAAAADATAFAARQKAVKDADSQVPTHWKN